MPTAALAAQRLVGEHPSVQEACINRLDPGSKLNLNVVRMPPPLPGTPESFEERDSAPGGARGLYTLPTRYRLYLDTLVFRLGTAVIIVQAQRREQPPSSSITAAVASLSRKRSRVRDTEHDGVGDRRRPHVLDFGSMP